ncbi:MAG: flavodoxin domain-containing protein [Candidatus Omnitrophica bacterium]|nr:flavodoxin domain-containing protein [Candidatus Omnitrophota bacterium]MDD5592912.1 flavodoxin domain-containing protein [Candidatus Omnitrophota bacterium]
MARALVIYYSRSGNTKKMAESVAEGIEKEGLETVIKEIKDVKADELLQYEAIAIGSPTYYGTMAYEIKRLLDESVKFHGKLDGRVGAAFSSSANIGGGNETTVLDILKAMLIHGMIIQGDPQGDHYGAVAIDAPDTRSTKQCLRLGVRVAKLVKRLK